RSRADRWTAPGAIVAVSDRLLVADEGSEAVFEIRSGQVKTYATGPKDWYPQGLAPMPDGTVLVATYDGVWRVPSGGGKVRAVDIDLAGTVDGTAAGRSIVGAASTANGTFHLLVAGEAEQYEFWDAINRLRLAGTKHGAKKLTSSMVRLAYSWLPNATLLSYYPDGTQEMTELGLDAIAVAASDDGAYVSLGNPPKRKFGLSSRGTKQLARLSKGDRERAAELMRALNAPPRILKVAR
ncbi:MAG TPA: hypothetical protein PKB03_11010, partial [Baekduia sp.]|nr:hypothetical protein [Baekduia sp.]